MMSEISVTDKIVPVSILLGPIARAVLPQLIAANPKCRFGLLASTTDGAEALSKELVIASLPPADHGGRDLRQVKQQIVALASNASVQHLLIECDSETHPIAFASLFLPGDQGDQELSKLGRLTAIVFAIDANRLVDSIVHGKQVDGVTSPCVLADQIESADSVVLTDASLLARAIISALNPRAQIVEGFGTNDSSNPLETKGPFDFEATFAGAGWRKLMGAKPGLYRVDQGVAAFLYRARRPFHPEKLWNLLQSPFPGVFRAKGFFWLATRMELVGGLNIAASEIYFSPAGEWWAAHAEHAHTPEIPDRIRSEWEEPFGDRRQAIAFMGIDIDADSITTQLDGCLLTDDEMKSGAHHWTTLPDPFPEWAAGHHHHDHECNDEGCSHH